MAFQSNSPVTLSLPAFRGVTRRLILTSAIVFLVIAALRLFVPLVAAMLLSRLVLAPGTIARHFWSPLTFSFVSVDLISVVLALLSLWMFGTALEDARGPRWLAEYFFAATIGGGVLACLLSLAVGSRWASLSPAMGVAAAGMWPAVMAVMLAFAHFFPEERIRLLFVISVKARHVAAIYLFVYLAMALCYGDPFSAVTALCVALSGWLYLRYAPCRGLRFAASETMFGWRNAWYRAKRKRAAKKFTVYMRRQGKEVNLDASGRYLDLDSERGNPNDPRNPRDPRNPNDKRWMN
jgi:membrane associated rhomboid family serine protease